MLNIEPQQPVHPFALFNLGFRSFFLGAGLFALFSMVIWMGIYSFDWQISLPFAAQSWHAHEMIFGYAFAVIAGFLLTAVKNWTNRQTLHGIPLAGLTMVWMLARVLPFVSGVSLTVLMFVDCLFILLLLLSIARPIYLARQKQHAGILILLLLMFFSHILFYLGLMGQLEQGVNWGIYSGVYLVLGLIFLMGRRVIPFFIEKGVGYPVSLKNYQWIDYSIPVIFALFWLADVFSDYHNLSAVLAAILVVLHTIRLAGWYTHGIWKKPLLWVLYLAYLFIVLGFLLIVAANWFAVSPYIALHAFTVGGIALITQGMMSRVAIGHTGRNVFEPPGIFGPVFGLLIISIVVRVIAPLINPENYLSWILVSQFVWIISFSMFVFVLAPMLIKPRADGRHD